MVMINLRRYLLIPILFVNCLTPSSSRSISKHSEQEFEHILQNSTHYLDHISEQVLRRQASVVVVAVFLSITVGMFCCCRYLPELLMEHTIVILYNAYDIVFCMKSKS